MTLPFEKLRHDQLRRLVWLCHSVTLSGLAPHDKLLLLLLLQLDPLAQGISLPWREITTRTKLSLSSCRRAAERLELLHLISIHRQFSEHREPNPCLFTHLLQHERNLWFSSQHQSLFQAEFLDSFLEMRAGFEEALKNRIEELHPGKGSKWKKQERLSPHSPRSWRQIFRPFSEDGEALHNLSRYGTREKKAEASKRHIQDIVAICLREMLPQATVNDLLQVTPKQCLAWIKNHR